MYVFEFVGQPPLTATASILISINDINDNIPVFPQTLYSASIPENQNPGMALPNILVSLPSNTQTEISIIANY